MVFLKKFQNKILLFIKDVIVTYDGQTQAHVRYPIPILHFSLDQRIIISVCISKYQDCFAVALSNKQLVTFDNKFNVISNISTKRVASKIKFTATKDLIIADKKGNGFVHKWGSHEKPKRLLGHQSMLLDVEMSECGKYIISCDRDEKIRVSHYPNTHLINAYCLGHSEFVNYIIVYGKMLLSASGDGTVRLWDYFKGEQKCVVNTNQYVKDKAYIHTFCEGMSVEFVDIDSLPVSEIQLYVKDMVTYLAVTILEVDGVQIYTVDALEIKYIETVMVSAPLLAFCLDEQLFMLTTSEILVYTLSNVECTRVTSNFSLMFNHIKHFIESYVDLSYQYISTLYKRKYNNVEEYLEKKRMRLENKSD